MKYTMRKKIDNRDKITISKVQDSFIRDRVRSLIDNSERLYNEELNLHYVLCDCYTIENFAENCLELRIIIEILNSNTADVYLGVDFKDIDSRLSLLENDLLEKLLPTK